MSTDDDIDALIYVHAYPTEPASRTQFVEFEEWLLRTGIDDWVFCGRGETVYDDDSVVWFIAVVDATPDGRTFNEFTWTGDLQDIDEADATAILTRARPSIARMRHPEAVAAVMRPDGKWVIPRAQR